MKDDKISSLKSLADMLDTKYKGPMGVRIGWDGIIGLIPVVGDLFTASLSIYIIIASAMLGCHPTTLTRMALNVAIENVFDAIPIFGNLFDFYWKSNVKNVKLLETYLQHPEKATKSSMLVLGLICFGLISFMVLVTALSIKLLVYLVSLF